MNNNPFAILTPEEMSAEQANRLFVEMYSDFPTIKRPGNSIISGARGCGKSMFIRCCLPDVQMIKQGNNTNFEDLEDLTFWVCCEKTYPRITEFDALKDVHSPYRINEHFLALHVLMSALHQLSTIKFNKYVEDEYHAFFQNIYSRYMRLCWCKDTISPDYSNANNFFASLYRHTEELQSQLLQYPEQFTLNTGIEDYTYNMPILSFARFIVPVFTQLVTLTGFPKNKNVIIYIDDADNLSLIQTRILNSWISSRTQPKISLKITTQIGLYKTYLTSDGVLIESPHDFKAVNISIKHTTNAIEKYYVKAVEIIGKRLELAGINSAPNDFFPPNQVQEQQIIELKLNAQNDNEKQNAVPNYIASLPQRTSFNYAGLKHIINLSSGIIRFLLDSASDMYDEQCAESGVQEGETISQISYQIQDRVLRSQADTFLYSEMKKSYKSESLAPIESPYNDIEKLQNLIVSMGRTFHEYLVDRTRVRRNILAIKLSSSIIDKQVKDVLQLGVRLGFLHEYRAANIEGNGRTLLFKLNRCLAPLFTLDPVSTWTSISVTNESLLKAIKDAKPLRPEPNLEDDNWVQLELFDYADEVGIYGE